MYWIMYRRRWYFVFSLTTYVAQGYISSIEKKSITDGRFHDGEQYCPPSLICNIIWVCNVSYIAIAVNTRRRSRNQLFLPWPSPRKKVETSDSSKQAKLTFLAKEHCRTGNTSQLFGPSSLRRNYWFFLIFIANRDFVTWTLRFLT